MQKLAQELDRLKGRLIEMGDAVESMVIWAGTALVERHPEAQESRGRRADHRSVPDRDRQRSHPLADCLFAHGQRSPVPADGRPHQLKPERIGDQSLNNCEYPAVSAAAAGGGVPRHQQDG